MIFGNNFVSNSLDNLSLVGSEFLNSDLQSLVFFNAWIELNGSSFILQEGLVDAFLVWISVVGDWLDSVSVVLEVLVMIGVIFTLCHVGL